MSTESDQFSFMIVTDVGCDADDLLAIVLLINTLRHRSQSARIAFVLTMLNPADKALYVNHLFSIMNINNIILEVQIFLGPGYNTLEEANQVFPNFPPRFGKAYDQLQGIDSSRMYHNNIFSVKELSRFTSPCPNHSIHLLVLSPVTMVNDIDFKKINLQTAHMMAGITDRKGVKKIGYNIGVSPKSFVALCKDTEGQIALVTPVTCDNVRMAADFQLVKKMIKLDTLGDFIFDAMMKWHQYITKGQTNFLEIDTPCMSDLVATDVFLRKIFSDYDKTLSGLLKKAVKDEYLSTIPALANIIQYSRDQMSVDETCTLPYLEDLEGSLFNAENGTRITFLDALIDFSSVSIRDYSTFLIAAVFANFD